MEACKKSPSGPQLTVLTRPADGIDDSNFAILLRVVRAAGSNLVRHESSAPLADSTGFVCVKLASFTAVFRLGWCRAANFLSLRWCRFVGEGRGGG